MKVNPAPLHLAQAVIISLVAVFSVTIIGTAAHTLDVFKKQQSSNPWWVPLWPNHFDTHGTKALIGAATATFVLSVLFLVFALVPKFDLVHRPTFRALLAFGTSLPSALVTLVTVIYAHILNNNSPQMDTLQTWTCKYRNHKPLVQGIPNDMGNKSFQQLCMESRYAVYGTLVVFLLLSMNLALSVVTWLADKWAARQNRKEMEMGSPQS